MELIVIVSVTAHGDMRIKLGEPVYAGCFTYVKLTVELFGKNTISRRKNKCVKKS